jgi:outer membrane lipoprotein-sorting protein
MPSSLRSGRIRWAAPFVVAAVIGLVAVVPTLSAGAATPSLPPLTPQQLLANVQQTNVQHLSGTIQLKTNLGIPNLGALAEVAGHNSGFNPTDLLSGSHSAQVWIDGPDRQKIKMTSSLAETDVIHSGQDVWTWQSTGSKVEHVVLSGHGAAGKGTAGTGAEKPDSATKAGPMQTPAEAANAILAQIDPSTKVSVSKNLMVAGQKAYELTLTPNDNRSTVAQIAIAVDSNTSLPLRVSIFAVGQKAAAFQLSFTKLNYTKPSASNFNFSPPPGAKVTTKGAGTPQKAEPKVTTPEKASPTPEKASPTPDTGAGKTQTVGTDWTQVVIFSNSGQLPRQANAVLHDSAHQVTGKFGTGWLVHTSLVNVLVLDDGRIAAGAVTPLALENAVATAH